MKAAVRKMVEEDAYSLEFSNRQHLEFMLEPSTHRDFASLLFGQNWVVHVSKAQRQFMTSDSPVSVIVPEQEGWRGASFLERTHYFPLAPDLLIEARPPKGTGQKKIRRKTYFQKDLDKIDEINIQLLARSKFVYASRSEQVEWCKDTGEAVQDMDDKMQRLAEHFGISKEEMAELAKSTRGMSQVEIDKTLLAALILNKSE